MEDSTVTTPSASGPSPQRKPRKRKEETPPVTTPSKLRTIIKPTGRDNGNFAASATKRRAENQDKEGRTTTTLARGYKQPIPAPSTDDKSSLIRDNLGKTSSTIPEIPGPRKTGAHDAHSETINEDPFGDTFSPQNRPKNDSPSVGRLSTVRQELLKTGLKELDQLVKRISANTGLTIPQVKERWRVKDGRMVSAWNIYQDYFGENLEEELERLPDNERKMVRGKATPETVAAAWIQFKKERPETYQTYLHAWNQLKEMERPRSMSSRTREFAKFEARLQTIVDYGSNYFGFESFVVSAGSVVNQDQGLAMAYGSDSAKEFFSDRMDISSSTLLGHFRAHIYDYLSRQNKPTFKSKLESTIKSIPTASDYSEVEESSDKIAEVKALFVCMAEKVGLSINRKSFPWKNLASTFSKSGVVLHNYPENVPFPNKRDTKGIACLNVKQLKGLIDAFRVSEYPLTLIKTANDQVPVDEPVIIGIPPPHTSSYPRGRRLFLDPTRGEDRMGPLRLDIKTPTARKGKQSAQTQFASAYSSNVDESLSSDDDENPALGDGSPSLSTRTVQNTGHSYQSQHDQETSNTNKAEPLMIASILQRIPPSTAPLKTVRFEDQRNPFNSRSITPPSPPAVAHANKRKVSDDLLDMDESTHLTKKPRPECEVSLAHSETGSEEQARSPEKPIMAAPITRKEPENLPVSQPSQENIQSEGSYHGFASASSDMRLSKERDSETSQAITTESVPPRDSATEISDMEESSSTPTAEMFHHRASREYSPYNPSQAEESMMHSNSTVRHPDGMAPTYDPATGRQLFFNTYDEWDAVDNSHQYSHPYYSHHPYQQFFPHSMDHLPPPPIPPRPVLPSAPTTAYHPQPRPPVYPPRPGYYHSSPPMHSPGPSSYYPLSYPARFPPPPTDYHLQRSGMHQRPPQIRAAPPATQSAQQVDTTSL